MPSPTAFRLHVHEVDPVAWLAGLGGPPPSLVPRWPPSVGHLAIVVVESPLVRNEVEEMLLPLTRERLVEFSGCEADRRKLYFDVPRSALANAVPSIAEEVAGP